MRKFIVYMHTFPNGKRYIGMTSRGERRYENGKGYKKSTLMKRAIVKYGWDSVKTEILYHDLTFENAKRLEMLSICRWGTHIEVNGYNLTMGGEGCIGLSSESRQRMSDAHRGENNPFFGMTHSDESKQKISDTSRGRKHSDATRQQLSELKRGKNNPMYGKKHTYESRQKISENRPDHSGENNPMYGKTHSEETKQKISQKQKSLWTKERKYNHSKANRGENNPMYDKTHSEETKQKFKDAWTEERKREQSERSKAYWQQKRDGNEKLQILLFPNL